MNNSSHFTNPFDEPPTHALSEYISIGYQFALLLFGVPLNLQALYDTVKSLKSGHSTPRFALLKLNLVITDLMILLIYTISEISWTATFVWYGGPIMCKLVKFFHLVSFASHANIVVSIALDRTLTVAHLKQFDRKNKHKKRVKVMLLMSWLLAFLASIPQLLVWTVVTPFPNWFQCSTKWQYDKFVLRITESSLWESVYSTSHLLVVFYCPAAAITVAYTFIFISYRRCLKEQLFLPIRDHAEANLELSAENSCTSVHFSVLITHRLGTIVATPLAARQNTASRRTKIIRQTIMIAVAYVCCFAPYNFCALWRQLGIVSWRENNFEEIIGFLDGPIILNAVIDPILYKLPWLKVSSSRWICWGSEKKWQIRWEMLVVTVTFLTMSISDFVPTVHWFHQGQLVWLMSVPLWRSCKHDVYRYRYWHIP